MPSKPRSEWSAAYAARVARAEARGLSRQAARGHKAKEHVTRAASNRERAEMLGVSTAKDRAYARAYGRKIASQLDMQSDVAADEAVKKLEKLGPDVFRAMVKRMNAERAQYKRDSKAHRYVTKGPDYLTHLAKLFGDDDDPDPDAHHWYYYH